MATAAKTTTATATTAGSGRGTRRHRFTAPRLALFCAAVAAIVAAGSLSGCKTVTDEDGVEHHVFDIGALSSFADATEDAIAGSVFGDSPLGSVLATLFGLAAGGLGYYGKKQKRNAILAKKALAATLVGISEVKKHLSAGENLSAADVDRAIKDAAENTTEFEKIAENGAEKTQQ